MDLLMDTKGSQGRTPGAANTIQKKRALLYHYHSLKINTSNFTDQIGICLSKLKEKRAPKTPGSLIMTFSLWV